MSLWLFWTIAAVLFFAAISLLCWGLSGDSNFGKLRCPECWYNMWGSFYAGTLVCPECGHEAKNQERLTKKRPHRRLILTGCLLLAPHLGGLIVVLAWLPDNVLVRKLHEYKATAALVSICPPALEQMIPEKLRIYFDRPGDVNVPLGATPLRLAAYDGDLEFVKLLLARGAKPNLRPGTGDFDRTPLHEATLWGHTEVVRILLEHGADVNAQSGQDRRCPSWTNTLNMALVHKADSQLVELLIENGAQVIGANELYYAARYQSPKIVKALLARGVRFNQGGPNPTKRFGTDEQDTINGIAFFAIYNHNWPVLEFAIASGADPDVGYHGHTVLHVAAGNGKLRIAQMILKKGVDVNAHDSDGNSPLTYALEAGHQDMIALLRKHGATE